MVVVKGFLQEEKVDYYETFSLVIKNTIISVVLTLVIPFNWELHQVDVNNTF